MQQDRHVIRTIISGDEIGSAVGVQVSHRYREGPATRGEGLLDLECAIAIAQQDRQVIREFICGDQVGDAVGIQVSHRYREGPATRGEGLLSLEGAIAVLSS